MKTYFFYSLFFIKVSYTCHVMAFTGLVIYAIFIFTKIIILTFTMTRKKRKIKNSLYFEYNISFTDIKEILRQITYYAYQTGNAVCDYIIGGNYTYDSEKNRYYTYRVFLSMSKPIRGGISDFNIILERLFIYRPIYKVPDIKIEKYLFIDIANFSIGIPPGQIGSFYTVPLSTKLLFSSRIKNYFYRHWKYYKNYTGMLTQLEFRFDNRIMFYNVLSLTSQGLISEALELLRTESPFEYIRGSEDYESKLQVMQLQMLGFRRKYNFDNYNIPQKYLSIMNDIRRWKVEVQFPKVLILYGRCNSSKTKIILSFVQSDLDIEVINIFSLKDILFLNKNIVLFLNDVYIPLDTIDNATQIGLINRKKLGETLVQVILDSVNINSPNFDCDNKEIFNIIFDNLVIYDIENDFMQYLGNKVESRLIVDYFSSKTEILKTKTNFFSFLRNSITDKFF